MGDSTKLVKNSALYTIGNVLIKAFSFLLIPIYTSYLSTADYGITNLVSGFTALFSCIITLSLQYAVIRFYADMKTNQDDVAKLYGTVINFVSVFGIVLSLILIAAKSQWTDLFYRNVPFVPIVLLSIFISVVSALYTLYQDILKGMQDAKRSVVLSFVFFFLLLISNIIAIVFLKKGALGMVWATLVVNFIMVIYMMIDLGKRNLYKLCFDVHLIKGLLRYSLPLVPHTLSYNLTFYVTRVLINAKLSLSALGLFSLASQFGYVSDIILNSFQSAFQPWMFEMMGKDDEESRERIRKSTYSLAWIMGIIYLLVGTFSQEAIYIMADSSYWSAWKYVPCLVFSVALKSPLYYYTNFLYYDKSKTKYIFIATFIACVINIVLTWLFIPLYGIYGSILADILSMIVRVIITIRVSWKLANGIYSLFKLFMISTIPMMFLFASIFPSYIFFNEEISVSMFSYKLFMITLYIALAFYLNKSIIKNISFSKI